MSNSTFDSKIRPISEVLTQANTIYKIPAFQRPFCWKAMQWNTLWQDMLEFIEEADKAKSMNKSNTANTTQIEKTYFFGPMLFALESDDKSTLIKTYLVVDGQQRLTAMMLFVAALRNIIVSNGNSNTYIYDLEEVLFVKQKERLMVSKSKKSDEIFAQILRGNFQKSSNKKAEYHPMQECYLFFYDKLKELLDGNSKKYNDFESFYTGFYIPLIKGFLVVNIEAKTSEQAMMIFESLNSKSVPLTQADLCRNHWEKVFTSGKKNNTLESDIKELNLEEVHDFIWVKLLDTWMQNELKSESNYLDKYIRFALMLLTNKFVDVKNIYSTFKDYLNEENWFKTIIFLYSNAEYFVLAVKGEINIRPEKRIINQNADFNQFTPAIKYLNLLRTEFTIPFVMRCIDSVLIDKDKEHKKVMKISIEEFNEALFMLENYILRRTICGLPTNDLKYVLPMLYSNVISRMESLPKLKLGKSSFLTALAVELCTNAPIYPSDKEFVEKLQTTQLYSSTNRATCNKLRLMLLRLEHSINPGEPINTNLIDLSIEHIMPQTLTDKWRSVLGGEYNSIHQQYLNVLGNLTLASKDNNQKQQNHEFEIKLQNMMQSRWILNQHIAHTYTKWNKDSIITRGANLAKDIVKVYSDLNKIFENAFEVEKPKNEDFTGKKPVKLILTDGRYYEVSSWPDVVECTVIEILEYNSKLKSKLLKSSHVSKNSDDFIRSREVSKMYVNTNISANQAMKAVSDLLSIAELPEDFVKVEFKEKNK